MWLEDAPDLDSAESRIRELLAYWPGEFQVLDQHSHQVVAAVSRETDGKDTAAKNNSEALGHHT